MSKSPTYDSRGRSNPLTWPDEGTKLRDLVDYLRDATGCAAITIHSSTEGSEHISYYAKGDSVERQMLDLIRERGFYVHLAGKDKTPPSTSPTSWVSDGHEQRKTGWVELKRK